MENYWVYENWRNNGHRVRIHIEKCIHFKTDDEGNPVSSKGSKWHGPFDTLNKAVLAAKEIGGKLSLCRVCLKNVEDYD